MPKERPDPTRPSDFAGKGYGMQSDDLKRILERQREAFRLAPNPSHIERKSHLETLCLALKTNTEGMAQAICEDFGHRSPDETRLAEIFSSLEATRHAIHHLKRWMRPEKRPVSGWFLFGKALVIKQPLGVVGIIVPWNYPLHLAVVPLTSALAAGNRVMIKMSETAPNFGSFFAALIRRHFPENQIAVINGGPETGKAFSALPFDHLLFTGSTTVGRVVMKAASENLTPVTLELGGKSPAIIGPDYPIKKAASRIMIGKSFNAGQTCFAPDYVLVPENKIQEFVEATRLATAQYYPTIEENPDYTAIINQHHYLRLQSYLQDAQDQGATLIDLNPEGKPLNPTSRKMAPTLILGIKNTMKVIQEEIFGPLLPVVPYRTLEEAIEYVNGRPKPFALYYFDHDLARVNLVLSKTFSGDATVNDTMLHVLQNELPYGGVGLSGMGYYHGREGFETFSKKKGVFIQSRLNAVSFLKPPYGKLFKTIVRFMLR